MPWPLRPPYIKWGLQRSFVFSLRAYKAVKHEFLCFLISIIRKHCPELPIIIFTGLGYDEEMMQAARYAGANGYVSKGLGPSEIYAAVMRVLDTAGGLPSQAA